MGARSLVEQGERALWLRDVMLTAATLTPRDRDVLALVALSPEPLPWSELSAMLRTRGYSHPDRLIAAQSGYLRVDGHGHVEPVWEAPDLLRSIEAEHAARRQETARRIAGTLART